MQHPVRPGTTARGSTPAEIRDMIPADPRQWRPPYELARPHFGHDTDLRTAARLFALVGLAIWPLGVIAIFAGLDTAADRSITCRRCKRHAWASVLLGLAELSATIAWLALIIVQSRSL